MYGGSPLQIAETRDVDADRLNGSAKRRFSAERREIAGAAAAANVGGEVVAENTAGIGKAVGIFAGGGVEEHANGFLRLRAENDGASREFVRLASDAVDIEQAASAIAWRGP